MVAVKSFVWVFKAVIPERTPVLLVEDDQRGGEEFRKGSLRKLTRRTCSSIGHLDSGFQRIKDCSLITAARFTAGCYRRDYA